MLKSSRNDLKSLLLRFPQLRQIGRICVRISKSPPQSFATPLRSSGLKNLEKGSIDETSIFLPGTSKYCLVGEAWGFSGKQTGYYISPLIPVVGCWSCVKYGRKFGFVAKKDDCTAVDFEPIISEFLAHWNQKHKSITKGIKHQPSRLTFLLKGK